MHHNQHFKKRTVAIDPLPPAYSMYSFEDDDNSGRPLSAHALGKTNYNPTHNTLLYKWRILAA